MTDLRDLVAARIREADPDNTLPAADLGAALAPHFPGLPAEDLARFVERVNPGKRLYPHELALALVDHFNLDQEF